MIKQLTILSLLVIFTHCKSVYDQRQDGRLNVHTQFDNIMIVIATPADKGPSSLLSDIAAQILELRSLTSRNKQVSVADEEILEEGKDPLNVKILKFESTPESLEPKLPSSEIQTKGYEIPKIHDIKVHIDQLNNEENFHNADKKISSQNQQLLGKLGIAGKIHSQSEKLKNNDENGKIQITDIKDSLKEKLPEKFISFGTISSIDDKVIYNSEKKHSQENIDEITKKDIQKSPSPKNINEESTKNTDSKLKGDKSHSLNDSPSEKLDENKKIHKPIVEKIIRKIRQISRELENSLKDPIYQKSRTSLKKELPRYEDHKNEEAGDKNEVRLIADQKSQFLKPIGEMIENCGPGRIRNRYGICQFDESFN